MAEIVTNQYFLIILILFFNHLFRNSFYKKITYFLFTNLNFVFKSSLHFEYYMNAVKVIDKHKKLSANNRKLITISVHVIIFVLVACNRCFAPKSRSKFQSISWRHHQLIPPLISSQMFKLTNSQHHLLQISRKTFQFSLQIRFPYISACWWCWYVCVYAITESFWFEIVFVFVFIGWACENVGGDWTGAFVWELAGSWCWWWSEIRFYRSGDRLFSI